MTKFNSWSCLIALIFIQFPPESESTYSPEFIWAAINKTLDEDRLSVVDFNNEKIKVKNCVKIILYNAGSEKYLEGNYSGNAIFVNTSVPDFTTEKVLEQTKEKMEKINLGRCIPCLVMISVVNISSTQEEREYSVRKSEQQLKRPLGVEYWTGEEIKYQDYKLRLSQNILLLLQFKTPIQARHLVLVRLVERKEDLNKCHGKKYTKYPRRLVPIWEQVLFDHFKEARVLQGSVHKEGNDHTLESVKENGVWVWMCEEINRRLDLEDYCERRVFDFDTCQQWEAAGNFSTVSVNITDKDQCGIYQPRT